MISVIYDDRFLSHDTGIQHPERPDRLRAIVNTLKASAFSDSIEWIKPRPATIGELLWIHSQSHIDRIRTMAESGGGYLDEDTPVCRESYTVGLLSAGAWLNGVDEAWNSKLSSIVISRPPGHHAEFNRAMGFCLFSNAALAANYAVRKLGLSRVVVFDWDVHHGNGTQHILEKDERFFYCSMHQFPHYPGTGGEHEKGEFENVLNIPLPAGSTGNDYLIRFKEDVIPFIKRSNPQLLIISAGFDAARSDPLSSMELDPEDFSELLQNCCQFDVPIVLGLEGGYDLDTLGKSMLQITKILNDQKGKVKHDE